MTTNDGIDGMKAADQDLRQVRYERACWWLRQGIGIVPLKPHSKELQPGYGSQKAHITTPGLASKWFLNTNANLGVVLGGFPGLIACDWDNRQDYEAWSTRVKAETLTERTARGYHVFFFGPGLPSTIGNGCEFKTGGVCMVSPSVHPSGTIYQTVKDVPITSIDSENACTLFPFLSDILRKRQYTLQENARLEKPSTRDTDRGIVGTGIISRIKEVRSIVDEMKAGGVQLLHGGRSVLVGLCPFHDDHSPSLWVNPKSGLWGCNKPECPAAGTHDVINFRAMIRGVSNNDAIKQLAKEFVCESKTMKGWRT